VPERKDVVILVSDGSTALGFGHLVRVTSVGLELSADYEVHLVSRSESAQAIVEELTAWQSGGIAKVHIVNGAPSWSDAGQIANSVAQLRDASGARIVIIDGKYEFSASDIAHLSSSARLVLIDNPHAVQTGADLVVFPTCHFDPTVKAALGAPVSHGPDWTFVHPSIRSAAPNGQIEPSGTFVSLGLGDPRGLLPAVVERVIHATTEPLRVVAPRNLDSSCRSRLEQSRQISWVEPGTNVATALLESRAAVCAFGISAYEAVELGVPLWLLTHSGERDGDTSRFVDFFGARVLGFGLVGMARGLQRAATEPSTRDRYGLGGLGANLLKWARREVRDET
jgi:spore coat polysaccharide biosynthesis predicted glycosyltransferase SpsG